MQTNQTEQLEILCGLFQELNDAGIRYCHWKSTHRLNQALKGETDLDLLVDRADATRFREMLLRCDFKSFVSAPRRQYPAVEDYLGCDRRTGALVHLHVHYRLVLGEQYTKNCVLPLEQSFLDNTQMKSGVRVPTPELETIILVVRSLLKYRDRDALRDFFKLPGRGGLPDSTLKEFDGLLAQTNFDCIASAVESHADFILPDLILDFLRTLRNSPRDGWKLFHLRRHMLRVLAPYQRVGRTQARLEYYRAMLAQEMPIRWLRDFLLADRHKKPATGGVGIAFIGTDGAGKSTAGKQIAKWLSWRVNVKTFYMGTMHPSFVTQVLRAISSVGQLAYVACGRILGKGNRVTRALQWLEQFLTNMRFLAEGQDRYNRFVAGQRAIAQGGIVIYDRYPLAAVRIDGHAMDGPRIAATNGASHSATFAKLRRAEENVYRMIRPPEHILVLRVSPKVSQERKPAHRRERIDAKAHALADFSSDGLNVTEIDAEQPVDQVLLKIKSAIWDWM